jgi:hypothetical protein
MENVQWVPVLCIPTMFSKISWSALFLSKRGCSLSLDLCLKVIWEPSVPGFDGLDHLKPSKNKNTTKILFFLQKTTPKTKQIKPSQLDIGVWITFRNRVQKGFSKKSTAQNLSLSSLVGTNWADNAASMSASVRCDFLHTEIICKNAAHLAGM